MCDFSDDFDDFFDGEFIEDGFDDGMEDSIDPEPEDDKSDELSWDEAYWIGTGIGFANEEGRRKRRKQKDTVSNDPPRVYK